MDETFLTREELERWITYLEITRSHIQENIDRFAGRTDKTSIEYVRFITGQYQSIDSTLTVLYSLQRGDGLPETIAWDE